MQYRTVSTLLGIVVVGESALLSADLEFRHHFISRELPITDKSVGDYGLTALVDVDRDGDLDFVLGGRPFNPSQLYWFEFQAPNRWIQHVVGTNYLSDVGLAPLDVDRDGWIDLVCSGVWYRNWEAMNCKWAMWIGMGTWTFARSRGDRAHGTAPAGKCTWIFWRTCESLESCSNGVTFSLFP